MDSLSLYQKMYFIRRFEERLLGLFEEGILNGTTHACIGQEADCVGVVEAIRTALKNTTSYLVSITPYSL